VDSDGEPYTSNAFGKFVSRAFKKFLGKHVTNNTLRKAWVREYANPNVHTIAEREQLARRMHHSILAQIKNYSFVDRQTGSVPQRPAT